MGKLLPTDEAVRDPQLFAFRAQLQAAIARHDVQAVLDAVHPNIIRDGRKGYIASRYVRSSVDYRASLSRENGRWRLNFFVAGD